MTTQGQRIKELAAQAGVSVSKLADMAGIDRPALTRISNDLAGLGPIRAQRIADALGVPVSDVRLSRAEDEENRRSVDARLRSLAVDLAEAVRAIASLQERVSQLEVHPSPNSNPSTGQGGGS